VCREGPWLRRSPQGDAGRPGGADRRDRAIFKDLGIKLDGVQLSDLGKAKRIIISNDNTTIVGGGGKKDEISGRADQIRREIESTDSDYDREKLQERLAKLAGGVAQIKVGAATEAELKERKALFDDARAATHAALAEGIVAGGGVALLRAEKAIKKLELTGDEKLGAEIVANVLPHPLRYIAENAGVDGEVVVNRVRQMKGKNDGYNADKDEYCDLVAAGVIDPAKVVKTALLNGSSVAALLLTTDSLITEIPKDEEPAAGGGHGHDHGMGGMGGMGGGMGGMGMPGMM
jgi:chaperonin GroEL